MTMPAPAPEATFAGGVRDALPVVFGYLSIGFAAGVVGRAAGLSVTEVALMSLILYAGSAQFVASGLLAAATPVPAIVLTIFFVNLRHLLLSAALAPALSRVPAWRNALIGAQLTDETFVVAWSRASGGAPLTTAWMAGLNLTAWATWALASIAGAAFGAALGGSRALGFDFALTAMFAALLVLQLGALRPAPKALRAVLTPRLRGLVVALAAAMLAIAIILVVPGNWNIIGATLIAATLGLALERWTSGPTSLP